MNYIGNMFNYSNSAANVNESEKKFQQDVQEIINFAKTETSQIKVVNNSLTRTDESYTQWARGWGKGTTLTGTIDYISNKVISHSIEEFTKHISNLEIGIKEKDLGKIDNDIKILEKDITRNVKLQEGLDKINMVYEARYIDNLDNEGLVKLRSLKDFLGEQILAEISQYKEIVGRLNEELGNSNILIEKKILTEYPETSPHSNLEAFCYAYNRDITPEEASKWIEQGEILLKDIISGNSSKMNQDPIEAEKETTALTWALMNVAIKKGDGFQQGTFVLNDPSNSIYSFLSTHPNHYSRPSSHYAGRSPKMQEGIDVFNQPLPAGKRTLLFSQVEQMDGSKVLFLKPENYSADHKQIYDFTMHGYEFLAAQKNKVFYPGSDDLPNMRKERVPVEVLSAFNNFLEPLKNFKLENAELFKDPILQTENPEKEAKLYGIAFMKPYVDAIAKLDIYPAECDPETFYKTLVGMDHLDKRTGREVFIDISELQVK
ncbi:MAG: hypothetical protein H0V82_10760 [Candidatus Protochlamydia sp.]|nr:hypothetical protein [Candidatus Protochlamydia sp.]